MTDGDSPPIKEEKERKAAAIPLPARAPRRNRDLLMGFLMLLFMLLTSLYLLIWVFSAFLSQDSAAGRFRWPPPPKLADLPQAVSSIYASLRPERPADAAGAKAPAASWDGIAESDKGRKAAVWTQAAERVARLAPLPRLRLIPYLFGSAVTQSGAFLEPPGRPKPAETSVPPQPQGGAGMGAGGGLGGMSGMSARRRYRYCKPNEKPTERDPCIADASDVWVKWPLGLHPKAFTVSPEMLAKLRDPGPYPENIIDEEEENRPRSVAVVLTSEDVDAMFEAVTGISDGQTLRGRTAYAQLVEARGHSVRAGRCSVCKPDSKVLEDRGSYFGEKMKLQ